MAFLLLSALSPITACTVAKVFLFFSFLSDGKYTVPMHWLAIHASKLQGLSREQSCQAYITDFHIIDFTQ